MERAEEWDTFRALAYIACFSWTLFWLKSSQMPDFSEGIKKQPKPTGAGGCGGAFAADLGFMAALSMGMSMAIGRLLRGICILDGATTPDPARIKKRQITEKVLHD